MTFSQLLLVTLSTTESRGYSHFGDPAITTNFSHFLPRVPAISPVVFSTGFSFVIGRLNGQ